MANYCEKLGECRPDNLIASVHVGQHTASGVIAAGAGEIKRGSVLAKGEDGALSLYSGGEGATPYGILCDDVTVGDEDTVVEVYLAGCFNKNALIAADGYELTADDIQTLRNGGIFVENAVKM